jgi:hypothetical protein
MRLFNLFKKKTIPPIGNVSRETLEEGSPLAINLAGITQAQLDYIFKYGKGSNRIGKYESLPFVELPYGVVRKDMITLQKKDLHAEAIMLLLGCQYDKVDLKGISQNDIFNFLVWIKKQHDKIFNMEKFYLKSDPDPHMIAAGVHRLDEFGALATIHTLALNDISKHAFIEGLPYYKVYEVLKLEKVQKEIQKAYAELIKPPKTNTRK